MRRPDYHTPFTICSRYARDPDLLPDGGRPTRRARTRATVRCHRLRVQTLRSEGGSPAPQHPCACRSLRMRQKHCRVSGRYAGYALVSRCPLPSTCPSSRGISRSVSRAYVEHEYFAVEPGLQTMHRHDGLAVPVRSAHAICDKPAYTNDYRHPDDRRGSGIWNPAEFLDGVPKTIRRFPKRVTDKAIRCMTQCNTLRIGLFCLVPDIIFARRRRLLASEISSLRYIAPPTRW
ncbi:hypothetical protein BCCR75502_07258 (plasmid) [Burkholderia sola]|nr:hypothetical protein BCCR12632_07261 [Burkholderia cenocepacia]CAG2384142.1 hypothetical protein BCCR75387_07248 [Burkholderia cenocepacia]CAG2384215.1 hypothetical protein BCCR75388_07235 [Burkholderia cenocepacia]CAG2384272.1 hypothetical protein BCCR75384_07262 [Burkholderia cenocepacia]CAG2386386.1 hypothetical protein BCCR75385_07263 [Burkholderia cenocepacia]